MYKKTLLVCASFHHNNTFSIAKAIGVELDAKIIKPSEFDVEMISEYDLIGFGSGIYNGKHHQEIFDLIENVKAQDHKHAFIFSTSTIPFKTINKSIKESLTKKGFDIIGEFNCKGFMDYSFTKYFGGLNKGRPNAIDIEKARDFARMMSK